MRLVSWPSLTFTAAPFKPTDLSLRDEDFFLEYSMSVIVARALPDVRDGLKPVPHRRRPQWVRLALHQTVHIRSSVAAVAEVAVSTTTNTVTPQFMTHVRMSQTSMRFPLIDGHGNFGSSTAIHQQQCVILRHAPTRSAMEMLAELNKNTVDLQSNPQRARKRTKTRCA